MIRAALLASLTFVAPAAASAAIVVENAQIRPTFGAQGTSAAYMTVRNTGKDADTLTSASCACAAMVMAHRTTTVGGVARMSMEHAVTIPAGDAVTFAPGGLHLMITGVKAPIAAGAKVPLQLTFAKAGKVTAAFVSSPTAGMGSDSHHSGR